MYSKSSPYYNTQLTNGYLDIIEITSFPKETDDILYEITKIYDNRPDLLANDLYRDSNLWWVFAVRNKQVLKDPVFDFQAGTKIYLPKLATIKKFRDI